MGDKVKKTIDKSARKAEKSRTKKRLKEKAMEEQASELIMPQTPLSAASSLSAALASLAKPSALAAEPAQTSAVAALFAQAKPAPLPSAEEVASSFKAPSTKAQKRKRHSENDQPLTKRLKTSDDPEEIARALDEQAIRAGEIRRAKKQQQKEDEHKTIFVGNVALTVTRKTLKKHFAKFGEIKTVRLRSVPVGTLQLSRKACAITGNFHEQRSSCNAYVVFETIESAIAALESNGALLEGKHIRVDRIIHSSKDARARDTASIFIGNLPYDVEEEELWTMFASCGTVEAVRVVRDKVTNQGKGIAYVTFKEGKSAVSDTLKRFSGGAKLRGRELRLDKIAKRSKLAKPEEKKKNRDAALKRAAIKNKPLGGEPTGRPVKGSHVVKGAPVKAGKMRRSEAPSYQGKMAQEGKIPRMKLSGDKAKKYKSKPAKKKKTVRSGKR